ncbi:D-aminoacyl-tRNA deacylase-like [Gigantopelta aegis]|uniref:D-aminoacyl-tRNA deacylase-like n=1 Tax=Gigantopelta aegis TaxID=1735272 RepID=UPI001B88D7A1|nr:D-aminoacyl-tRNA deacylase-like [Gigantopelta aegis]
MKAIVQRVMHASVTVGDEVVGSVGRGLCILLGISRHDTAKDMDYMVRKILRLRIFDDDQGKRWMKNVMEKDYDILCVSQFTLNVTLKGNKPDFHESMGPDLSQQMYGEFLKQLGAAYDPEKIKDGKFGAYMQVLIENDGPVTIPLDSAPLHVASGSCSKSQKKSTDEELASNEDCSNAQCDTKTDSS